MKRRIFIAINLPETVKKRLIEYSKKWNDLDPSSIRWTNKNNLHITLLFIGHVDDDEMYDICMVVKEVIKKHKPFNIRLERIILGPQNKIPRMFWAQGEKSQELADLQADLQEKIEQRHGARHAFRPHITLSRFKSSALKQLPKEINEPFQAQVPVENIEIMQSNLKRSGAEYSILESINL